MTKAGGDSCKMSSKDPGEEERQEVTSSLAAAEEIRGWRLHNRSSALLKKKQRSPLGGGLGGGLQGSSGFFRVLQVSTGFLRVLQGSSGFLRVLQCSSGLLRFFRVPQGSPGFSRVLQGSSGHFRFPQGSSGFFRVLQGFTGFFRVTGEEKLRTCSGWFTASAQFDLTPSDSL